jgi:hypothetical protein
MIPHNSKFTGFGRSADVVIVDIALVCIVLRTRGVGMKDGGVLQRG